MNLLVQKIGDDECFCFSCFLLSACCRYSYAPLLHAAAVNLPVKNVAASPFAASSKQFQVLQAHTQHSYCLQSFNRCCSLHSP
jgi:hypothetical protein